VGTEAGFEGIDTVGVDDPPPDGVVGTFGAVGVIGTVYSLLVVFYAIRFFHMPSPTVYLT
jgi:hypothetical protein